MLVQNAVVAVKVPELKLHGEGSLPCTYKAGPLSKCHLCCLLSCGLWSCSDAEILCKRRSRQRQCGVAEGEGVVAFCVIARAMG